MRQFTILHTIETSGPGGAESVLLQLASTLDPKRFRSFVVLTGEGWLRQQLLERKIQHEVVTWKAWYDLRLPRALVKLIRREGVDLIHSHLPDQNFYSCLAASWTNRPAVVTYHGPVELTRSPSLRKSLKLRYVRRQAEVVVVVCEFVGRMLKQANFPPEKIACIYNGIDTDRFASAADSRLRKTQGWPQDSLLIGMVANIRQSKGYEFFIRAARKVVDAFPKARFIAVGDIDEMLGPNLRLLVEQLNLLDHFTFLGFRPDVPELLKDFDVFVLSSISEGFPLVVLEAMAAGKPAVVTRCGGPEEIIEDGKTGFLVPPSDADALAAKIQQILADSCLASHLGQNAQARVKRNFSLEKMLSEYEALYERCLA